MKRTKINRLQQFRDIIQFEFLKFIRGRKIKAAVILAVLTPLLIYTLPILTSPESLASQSSITDFAITFVQFLSLLILISVTLFGGDALISDFQDKTGYTLFTNPISRTSLLFGKFVAASLAVTIVLGIFYIILAALSYFFYSSLPSNLLISFFFAVISTMAFLSISFAIGSFLKGSSISYIAFFFLFFLVFPLVDYFLIVDKIKPWFSPTFANQIILYILETPYPEDQIIKIPAIFAPGQTLSITAYVPEINLSLGILFVYIMLGLIVSLFFFQRKEMN